MKFPQYLWRIRDRQGWILIRRGNDCNEPILKWYLKDWYPRYAINSLRIEQFGYPMPVGVADVCDIDDAKLYSRNHDWDWLNE